MFGGMGISAAASLKPFTGFHLSLFHDRWCVGGEVLGSGFIGEAGRSAGMNSLCSLCRFWLRTPALGAVFSFTTGISVAVAVVLSSFSRVGSGISPRGSRPLLSPLCTPRSSSVPLFLFFPFTFLPPPPHSPSVSPESPSAHPLPSLLSFFSRSSQALGVHPIIPATFA